MLENFILRFKIKLKIPLKSILNPFIYLTDNIPLFL